MTIEAINLWHQRARPEPTEANLTVQVGCHLEEFLEMISALKFNTDKEHATELIDAFLILEELADGMKSGDIDVMVGSREDLLDSLADQIVTAVGIGHCTNMNVPKACTEVNKSNWSKFDKNGQPILKAGGKIAKGPDYTPPDLTGLY